MLSANSFFNTFRILLLIAASVTKHTQGQYHTPTNNLQKQRANVHHPLARLYDNNKNLHDHPYSYYPNYRYQRRHSHHHHRHSHQQNKYQHEHWRNHDLDNNLKLLFVSNQNDGSRQRPQWEAATRVCGGCSTDKLYTKESPRQLAFQQNNDWYLATARISGGGGGVGDGSKIDSEIPPDLDTMMVIDGLSPEEDDTPSLDVTVTQMMPMQKKNTNLESTKSKRNEKQKMLLLFTDSFKVSNLIRCIGGTIPPIVTVLILLDRLKLTSAKSIPTSLSVGTLYGLALVGSSCGFGMFLYFITVGYALGITLPVAASLFVYQKQSQLPTRTVIQACMTIFWGIRLASYLLWREYIGWPNLHNKFLELQSRMNIPYLSKLLCWFVYSAFYVAMILPVCNRLQTGATWGKMSTVGLILQGAGLLLEVVADFQKSKFKSRHRHSWCDIGVWKWSTFPNYLGEAAFWWGSYLTHIGSIRLSKLYKSNQWMASIGSTVGILFLSTVLKGSTKSLSKKQWEKYGEQKDFQHFQHTHTIVGPKILLRS